MRKEDLQKELQQLEDLYQELYAGGCRAATAMGVLSSEIEILKKRIGIEDLKYQWT